jgi:hypothetical protein
LKGAVFTHFGGTNRVVVRSSEIVPVVVKKIACDIRVSAAIVPEHVSECLPPAESVCECVCVCVCVCVWCEQSCTNTIRMHAYIDHEDAAVAVNAQLQARKESASLAQGCISTVVFQSVCLWQTPPLPLSRALTKKEFHHSTHSSMYHSRNV